MQVIRADTGVIVTLPLAQQDPWPGAVPTALAIPAVLAGSLVVAALGWLGDLGPWLVGAAPIASLFLPLVWLIRRSRARIATLVFDALVLRVVVGRSAPVFHPAVMRAAVAMDRLSVEEGAQRVELQLEPLDRDEVNTLRAVLRELTAAAS